MPDEDLVNALAQYLEFEPMEKLALLERQGPLARCRSMVELLEMKAMAREPGAGSRAPCTNPVPRSRLIPGLVRHPVEEHIETHRITLR